MTQAATAVTGTGATLNGELNPHASGVAGYEFTYSPNGTCEGTTTKLEAEKTGKGIKVSKAVTGLEGSSEYTFCVVATHAAGTENTSGPPLTFTTSADKPLVESQGNSAETPFAATVEASVNPENQSSTSCVFEYGETNTYGLSAPCEPETLEGAGPETTTARLAGLEPGTTYHFRVVVTNATGETKATDAHFATLPLEKPIVVSEGVSKLSALSAVLEATINPNYQETSYSFEYAKNESELGTPEATTVSPEEGLPGEFAEFAVSLHTGVLQPGTTYHYRVLATNGTGTTEGPSETFATPDTAVATTAAATGVTRTTAVLAGTVNPEGAPTTYHFAFISQAGYASALAEHAANPYAQGRRTAEGAEVGSDYTAHAVGPTEVTELQPGTTYHYAVVTDNTVGTTIGPDRTFTTAAPTPPVSTTGAAEGVTQISALINGVIDTRGLPTVAHFELGTSPANAGPASAVRNLSTGVVAIAAGFNEDLQPGTVYYYRVVASNTDGTTYGAWQSFTTAVFPSPFAAISSAPLLPATKIPGEVIPKTVATPPTRAQKLAEALKKCQKKPKKQRASCKRQANKKYGPVKKKK